MKKIVLITISILFLTASAYSSERMTITPLCEDQLGQHGSYSIYKDDGTFEQRYYFIQRPPYYEYQHRQEEQDNFFWYMWENLQRQNQEYRNWLKKINEQ
ncbi:MAG: hypothetical protein AMJ42_03925 [Deltaproteobacteria bacterium DG_8]|nr:MAG: hypothetical protein AMJ42_03925 [Deltaproteobacteria bacterium DG_8]